jgi:hypothetical protein
MPTADFREDRFDATACPPYPAPPQSGFNSGSNSASAAKMRNTGRPLAVVVLRSDCMAFGIEPRIDAVMEAEPSCTPGRNTFCAPGTRTPFGLAGYPIGAICGARNT